MRNCVLRAQTFQVRRVRYELLMVFFSAGWCFFRGISYLSPSKLIMQTQAQHGVRELVILSSFSFLTHCLFRRGNFAHVVPQGSRQSHKSFKILLMKNHVLSSLGVHARIPIHWVSICVKPFCCFIGGYFIFFIQEENKKMDAYRMGLSEGHFTPF